MRKLLLALVALVIFCNTFKINAQSIQETFTICVGETVTFPAPTNFALSPGFCLPSITGIFLLETGERLDNGITEFTLQPDFGQYTVVIQGLCNNGDPVTGLIIPFSAELRWIYEVKPSAACQDTGQMDALFVDYPWLSNACGAACAGVEVASEGEGGCFCTFEIAPVCGVDGKTYSNPCLAACAGVEVASVGECNSNNAIFNDYPWLTA